MVRPQTVLRSLAPTPYFLSPLPAPPLTPATLPPAAAKPLQSQNKEPPDSATSNNAAATSIVAANAEVRKGSVHCASSTLVPIRKASTTTETSAASVATTTCSGDSAPQPKPDPQTENFVVLFSDGEGTAAGNICHGRRDADDDVLIRSDRDETAGSGSTSVDYGSESTSDDDVGDDDNTTGDDSNAVDGAPATTVLASLPPPTASATETTTTTIPTSLPPQTASTTVAAATTVLASLPPPTTSATAAAATTVVALSGGSSRRIPLPPARKTTFNRSSMDNYSPPRMPPSAHAATDPVVAALEPHFAAHLAQEAPAAANRHVRFSPQRLWDYMCYCYGYGAAEARLGTRAHKERKTAVSFYMLREDDDADRVAARGGNGTSYGWSPWYTLWIKGRRGAPTPRAVVATDDIVATVMRVHRELGHADEQSTTETVARSYFGIAKQDVKWVVARCPKCCDLAPERLLPSTAAPLSTRQMALRSAARKTAAVPPDDADAASATGLSGIKRKRL